MLFTKMAKLLGIKHTWKWQCEQTWQTSSQQTTQIWCKCW